MPPTNKPAAKPGGLMAKLGAKVRDAVKKHKNDETKVSGGGDIPAGVTGIAKLTDCYFKQYEKGDMKGQYFFYAAGACKEPKKAKDGTPVEGLRTSIMEPVCDTPNKSRKTVEDHVAWILNEWRKLGVDTSDLDPSQEGVLEATAAALKEAAPLFKFNTYSFPKRAKGDPKYDERYDGPNAPEPRVNHNWNGIVEDGENTAVEDDVQDETGESEDVEAEEEAQEEQEEQAEEESGEDLDALATAADEGDKAAAKKLKGLAKEAGLDNDDVENAENWVAVVEMINGAGGEEEEEAAEEEEEEWKPAVGDVYKYKPKGAKKPIEVEVVFVASKSDTCNVKNLDTNKVEKGVAFAALIRE